MTPAFKILVNGKDKTAAWADRVESIVVKDNDGINADSVTITLDDRDYKLSIPDYDEKLSIWLGFEEAGIKYAGTYSVNETVVKLGLKKLVINAKAADMIATLKEQRVKSWHDTTLGAIAEVIAGSNQLELAMSDSLSAIQIEHVDQTEESDMNLLTRLSLRYDAVFKVGNGKLIFTKKGVAQSASGQTLPVTNIAVTELVGTGNSIRANGRANYNGVKCRWRDIAKASVETVSAGTGAPFYMMRETATDAVSALARAQARLSQIKRGVLSLNLSVLGNVGLAAGSECVLKAGFKPEYVDSRWSVKTASHKFTSKSFITSITGELPTK